jgi:hypothetical protein
VGLEMKPVGEPYAGNPHVRFDERGVETERWPHGPKQPRLSSTLRVPRRGVLPVEEGSTSIVAGLVE